MPTFLDVFVNSDSFLPTKKGELEDTSVCDLACGEGFYTRQFRRLTRGRVVGIESNYDRLKLAKTKEDSESDLKIEYLHADFSMPDFLRELGGRFNLVCSIYRLD
jgi:toxoflavin synthase